MEEQVQDVQVASSPASDVQVDSSTTDSAGATAQQASQVMTQAVPYDRFKEKVDEVKYWREQAMTANQRQQSFQPQEPADPYAGMDANTKVFWQEADKRAEKIASRIISEKERTYQANIEALAMQNAKIQEKLFRTEQKDVQPGSQEEVRIAQLIRVGVDPEEAAWAVMGKARVEAAKGNKSVQNQVKVQQKAQANLENSSIPANNGFPSKEKVNFRQEVERRMREAGL